MTAIEDIAAERRRQIEVETWTVNHDDTHDTGEMARAAAAYALSAGPGSIERLSIIPRIWPWDWVWFKPRDRRRDLVRAGALIVAEIERLDRAAARRSDRGSAQ